MRKILLTIQYRGTKFCGWQSQENAISVEEVLEQKISELLGENIKLHASGRTDAGVHAIGQTAHFETNSNFNIHKLAQAINFGLDGDIAVLSAKEVSQNFHARYNVKQKTYVYKLYCSKITKPLKNDMCAHIKFDLKLDLMRKAAQFFIGEHNFFAFCSSKTQVKDFVRKIYSLEIKKVEDEYHFAVTGNGFLYNMVRIIVGTLVDVGGGKIKPEEIPEIIQSQDRKRAGKTMPAHGLYLKEVQY